MSAIGLYYPYIHVRRDDWLAATALYWPKLARLVPAGFQVRDGRAARTLAEQLDLIVDLPAGPAAASLAPRFLAMLDEYGDRLRARFALPAPRFDDDEPELRLAPMPSLSHEPPRADPPQSPARFLARCVLDELAGVHVNQIDPGVRDRLCALGLAAWPVWSWELDDRADDHWVGMRDEIAWLYVCALANEAAAGNALTPVTDQDDAQAFIGAMTVTELAELALRITEPDDTPPTRGELAGAIGMLALRLPGPDRRWSAADVVKVRERYGADFLAFRESVDQAAAELSAVAAEIRQPEALAAHLDHELRTRFGQPLEDLRRQLRGLGLEAATLTLNAKFEVPAAIAVAGGGALIAADSALAGGAAIAAGLLAVRGQVRQRSAELLAPSAAGYLLHTGAFADPPSETVRKGLRALRAIAGTR